MRTSVLFRAKTRILKSLWCVCIQEVEPVQIFCRQERRKSI